MAIRILHSTMAQLWHQHLGLVRNQQTSFRTSNRHSVAIHIHHSTMVRPWRQHLEQVQHQQTSFHSRSRSVAIPIPIRTMVLPLVLAPSGQQPQGEQSRESISC